MTDVNIALADLPTLDDLHDVDDATVAGFAATGHAAVHGLATAAELDVYRPIISDVALAHNVERRPLEDRGTYGKAFIQVPNLWRHDPRVARFVLAPRFARVAAQLLEVDAVRMYRDQALFKEAKGGLTPWHQDQVFWPLDSDRTITMWMPLVDVPAEVGTMTFASGSHRKGDLGSYTPSDASEAVFDEMLRAQDLECHTYGALRAGDTTWHRGWTLHRAPANPTGMLRAVFTITYFADGARVTEPSTRYQEADWKMWLDSIAPGELAAGPLNPVVWPPAAG